MREQEPRVAADLPSDPLDLLTEQERADLHRDLERMAHMRRRAASNAANIPLA